MKYILLLSFLFVVLACQNQKPMDLTKSHIIPAPASIEATGSSVLITALSTVTYNDEKLLPLAQKLSETLTQLTNNPFAISASADGASIALSLDTQNIDNPEGYILKIEGNGIEISANQPAGIFMGVQTLIQLVETSGLNNAWRIATGTITDKPTYAYRGAMLDVSRHFFSVQDVKRYIDLLAYYKMNALHLHLSDDQGWRIEIKSWPRLTEIGGSTKVDGGTGGHYTQEDYKELVNYAAERFVTIIPEIDMPGHTNAALASYAELNCDGIARELYTGTKVGFSTLCTDKEITYQFIDDVVRELAAITPGPYIHIGGDESHVTAMEDYIPFINRVQEIVGKYDKIMIGWDEIAHAALDTGSIVQFWNDAENAKKGIAQGASVLMSPAKKAYLDMKYDSTTVLGLNWAAYIEVDEAYNWEPSTYADGVRFENILGVEAPLWSETITNIEELEFLAFPRIICISEVCWTPETSRNWDEFKTRLATHGKLLDRKGVHYYKSAKVPWMQETK